MHTRIPFLAAVSTALFAACLAPADVISESGDSGQLPSTAQRLYGDGATLDAIMGLISTPDDVDLYLIGISDPKKFSATTVPTGGTLADTRLFLFDLEGNGVYANDNASATTARSTLPAGVAHGPQEPGYYYLGISAYDRGPADASADLLFDSFPPTVVVGPNPGVGPLDHWSGGGRDSGTYRINLTGANLVPEPTTGLLAMLGVATLASCCWRRFAAG